MFFIKFSFDDPIPSERSIFFFVHHTELVQTTIPHQLLRHLVVKLSDFFESGTVDANALCWDERDGGVWVGTMLVSIL